MLAPKLHYPAAPPNLSIRIKENIDRPVVGILHVDNPAIQNDRRRQVGSRSGQMTLIEKAIDHFSLDKGRTKIREVLVRIGRTNLTGLRGAQINGQERIWVGLQRKERNIFI